MGGRWVQTIDGRYICRNLYVILCILYIYIYIHLLFIQLLVCMIQTNFGPHSKDDLISISWRNFMNLKCHFNSFHEFSPTKMICHCHTQYKKHTRMYIYTYNIMILHLYIHHCLWLGVDTQLCPICLHWSSFQQPCRRQGLQVLPSIYCISYSGKF